MIRTTTKRKAFEERTFLELDSLCRTAFYLLDDETDAKDIVLKSIIKLYYSRGEGRFGSDHRRRIFKIMVSALPIGDRPSRIPPPAKNTADKIGGYSVSTRQVNRKPIVDTDCDPFSAATEAQVKKAIRELPRQSRLVVVLSMLEGFSYKEIAHIVNIDRETVRTRLRRGRIRLGKNLVDHEKLENMNIYRSAASAGEERTD